MHVQLLTDPQELVALRPAWNALSGDVPFRRYEWLMSWWRHYREEHQLYVLGVFDQDDLIGLAPWYKAAGRTGGRTLRFLGDGEVCSDYLDILSQPEHQEQIAPLLVDWLQRALTDENAWDAIEMDGLDAATPLVADLAEQMTRYQALVHRRPALNCWRLELPESWYDFEMLMSKSHRKQIRRLIKRVVDTDRCHLHVCDSASRLDEAMAVLIDLHMRRRTSLDQPGCFACDRFTKFLYAAASEMMTSGHCEILWVELDGLPIAAEIHFLSSKIRYAYQAGIDPDRMEEEPGSLMHIKLIQRAIDQGLHAIDFLRGDEPYKAHWRAESRPCETIRVVPNTTFGLVRHGIWSTKAQVKSWFKASLGKQ